MKELSIDIETYSEVDLRKSGVYRYAEDDTFEILLVAISVDNGPVTVYDLTKEDLPQDIIEDIISDKVINGLSMPTLNVSVSLIGSSNITQS